MTRLEDELKVRAFRNARHRLNVNLIYTSNNLHSQMQASFKEFGLTLQQFNLLRILRGQHPKPSTIQLLKERMIDKQSDVSRLVDRVKQKALVLLKPNQNDRRKKDVLISEKGLELLASMDEVVNGFESLMGPLTDEEVDQLNFLLDKMRD